MMKKVRIKRFLLLVGFLCLSAVANAEWQDTNTGLWVEWINKSAKDAVKVVKAPTGKSYSGDYTIPATIRVNMSNNPNEENYQYKPITLIVNEAFKGAEGLNSVIIEAAITTIGSGTFQNSGLNSIELPNSLQTIEANAFAGTAQLTTISIPQNVTTIASGTFQGSGLSSIELPISLQSIAEKAFYNTKNLTTISLPEHVTVIGNGAFQNSALEDISLPASLVRIEANAFNGSKLKKITIPGNVTYIGGSAFNGCSDLKKAIFTSIKSLCDIYFDGEKSNPLNIARHLYIGNSESDEISTLTIPSSVTNIPAYAFLYCESIIDIIIEHNVESIGESAFAYCSNLKRIHIPSSITTISKKAFQNDKGIKEIHYEDINSIFTISYGDQDAYPILHTATDIRLFKGENEIKDLTIINNIYNYSLHNTGTIIPKEAFKNCVGLENITISEGVTEIEEEAFAGCKNLKSVSIPSSITTIGKYAFKDDTKLTKASFASIKDLCEIDYPELASNATDLGPALQANPLYYAHNLYLGNSDTPEPEVSIPNESLKNGNLIRPYILAGVQNLNKVTIPSDATEIGRSAFSGCTGLHIAEYPSDAKVVEMVYQNQDANPLNYAKKLQVSGKDQYMITFNHDIEPYALANAQWLEAVVINENVTSIGAGAFINCKKLSGITIAENSKLKTIGDNAFYDCENLQQLDFSELSQLQSIGDYAFNNCKSQQFTEVTIPANCSLGTGVFKRCSELKKVIFATNDQRTIISPSCFEGCSQLKEITIPNTVTEIGNNAFSGCTELTNIPYGNAPQVETIGESAFANCTGFTEIAINKNLTLLRASAFAGCTNIKTVSLPETIESVLQNVFSKCDKLEKVIVYNTDVPFAHKEAFGGKQSQMELYVPKESQAEYSNGAVWKEFKIVSEYGTHTLAFYINDSQEPTLSKEFSVGKAIDDVYRNYKPNLDKEDEEEFSGWSEQIPLTMPNQDINVYGYISKKRIINDINGNNYRFKYHLQPAEGDKKPKRATLIGVDYLDDNYTDVIIPDGVSYKGFDYPVKAIGPRAFASYKGKGRIGTITLPQGIEVVDTAAFRGCNNLVEVKNFDKITHARDSVFYNCSKLSKITLDNIEIIDTVAFCGCSHLCPEQLPAKIDSINYQGFANTGFEKVTLTKDIVLGNEAFKGCTDLKTVIFDEGCNTLPKQMFWNCASLEKVTLRGTIDIIQEGAFKGCTSLTSMDIPEGTLMLEKEAFMGCKKLISITLPESIIDINYRVFANCDTLRYITVKSDNPPKIKEHAFNDKAYNNAFLYVNKNAVQNYTEHNIWKKFIHTTTGGKHELAFYINDSEESIKSITLSVGAAIDDEYRNYKPNVDEENEEFSGWSEQIPLTMPDHDVKLYGYVSKNTIIGDNTYRFKYHLQPAEAKNNKQERATLIGVDYLDENYTHVVIPDEVTYDNATYPVKAIGSRAFDKYEKKGRIESITLPNNIEVVDTAAFRGCKELSEVINFDKITHARDSVFQNCSNLATIDLSNVIIIDTLAFSGCKSLRPELSTKLDSINYQAFANTGIETVTLAKNRNVFLDDEAFKGCENLTTVEIGEKYSAPSVPIRAFWNCTSLNKVTLEASIKSIHEGAFKGCTSLATVVIPEGVETLSREAFMGCNKLKTITLPSSILNIRDKAFAGDTLQSITVKQNNPPTLIENAFIDPTYQKAKLYVSDVDGYKNKNPWSKFGDNIQTIGNYTLTYIVDGNTETPYKTISDVPVGTLIEPLDSAVNVGHKFSGWLGEPESMPGANVTIYGKFKYKLSFSYADGSEKPKNDKEFSLPKDEWYFYGDAIDKDALLKTLQWAEYDYDDIEIPATMPAEDLNVVVKYKLAEQEDTINNIIYKVFLLEDRAEVIGNTITSKTPVSVVIPDHIEYDGENYKVTAIQDNAFANNKLINGMTLPSTIDSIGVKAFYDNKFETITIPAKVNKIGNEAFHQCTSLQTVNFASDDNIKTLPFNLFRNCMALENITVPSSVTKIEKSVFSGCSNLKSVTIKSTELPTADYYSFDETHYANVQLKVPENVTNLTDEPWTKFKYPFKGEESVGTQCKEPTISYNKGNLIFQCDTPEAEIVSKVVCSDANVKTGNSLELYKIYTITAYARKTGMSNSDKVVATITWRNGKPLFSDNITVIALDDPVDVLVGDVNDDGVVDTNDAIKVIKIYLKKE